jgi:hypothetical protein
VRVKTVETIRYIKRVVSGRNLDAKEQGAESLYLEKRCTPQFGFLGR